MFETGLRLPESQRDAFKEPLGREMPDSELDSVLDETIYLTVGDVVSLVFRKHGVRPRLSIYDGFTERREMTEFARLVENEPKKEVVNPAGTISAEMAEAVRRGIEGEEDLAVLPCLVLAPDGMRVVYGMPGRCMMVVETDQRSRDRAMELLSKMEVLE